MKLLNNNSLFAPLFYLLVESITTGSGQIIDSFFIHVPNPKSRQKGSYIFFQMRSDTKVFCIPGRYVNLVQIPHNTTRMMTFYFCTPRNTFHQTYPTAIIQLTPEQRLTKRVGLVSVECFATITKSLMVHQWTANNDGLGWRVFFCILRLNYFHYRVGFVKI